MARDGRRLGHAAQLLAVALRRRGPSPHPDEAPDGHRAAEGTGPLAVDPSVTGDHLPVVLLHGTNDSSRSLAELAGALEAAGHPVFTLDYGTATVPDPRARVSRTGSAARAGRVGHGLAPIATSAREIADFIDQVLATTGATQVDLVGHSQGGLHVHAYLRGAGTVGGAEPGYPGALAVRRIVTLGSSHRGVRPVGSLSRFIADLPGVGRTLDATLGPAAREQIDGSDVVSWIAAAKVPLPEHLEVIEIDTDHDNLVSGDSGDSRDSGEPGDRGGSSGPGAAPVRRHVLPGRGHARLPQDREAIRLVVEALD